MTRESFFFSLVLWFSFGDPLSAQDATPPDFEPFFNAILVEDIEVSQYWYQEVLGYEMVSESKINEGFSVVNLKKGSAALELIQLPTALSPAEAIPGFDAKTRINGFFKMGFLVVDLDQWMTFLQEKQVQLSGNVVQDPVTEKRMVIILDPDGNRVQLFEK